MARLETALQLNNEGVSLLLAAKEKEANMCLSQSLTIFQQILQECGTTNNQHMYSPSSSTESNDRNESMHNPFQVNMQTNVHYETVSLPCLKGDSFFIYDKAIRFEAVDISSLREPKHGDLNVFIAIVILNSSLAYHREAILGKNQYMAKAKTMYEMVTKLIIGKQVDICHQAIAFLISLAAINNLSLIFHQEGNYDFSIQSFHRLAFLLTKQQDDDSCILVGNAYDEIVTEMSLNVVFANTRSTMAGAA